MTLARKEALPVEGRRLLSLGRLFGRDPIKPSHNQMCATFQRQSSVSGGRPGEECARTEVRESQRMLLLTPFPAYTCVTEVLSQLRPFLIRFSCRPAVTSTSTLSWITEVRDKLEGHAAKPRLQQHLAF